MYGIADGAPLANGAGQRFLSVNIQARSGCRDSGNRMPVVGHRQLHSIEIAPPDQLAKVMIGCAALVAVLVVNDLFGPVAMALVDVADGDHLHFGFAQKALHIPCSLRANADRTHDDPAARRIGAENR